MACCLLIAGCASEEGCVESIFLSERPRWPGPIPGVMAWRREMIGLNLPAEVVPFMAGNHLKAVDLRFMDFPELWRLHPRELAVYVDV